MEQKKKETFNRKIQAAKWRKRDGFLYSVQYGFGLSFCFRCHCYCWFLFFELFIHIHSPVFVALRTLSRCGHSSSLHYISVFRFFSSDSKIVKKKKCYMYCSFVTGFYAEGKRDPYNFFPEGQKIRLRYFYSSQ